VLPADEEFDEFLGVGSGAGAIFGTTGGVMEAALR
jgi:iron only hydrogenase large subunit-like protein